MDRIDEAYTAQKAIAKQMSQLKHASALFRLRDGVLRYGRCTLLSGDRAEALLAGIMREISSTMSALDADRVAIMKEAFKG